MARASNDVAVAHLEGWTDAQVSDRDHLIAVASTYGGYSLVFLGEGMCSAALDLGPEGVARTVAEAGMPNYDATIWLGIMAPVGTPKPIVDKLNIAVTVAVKRPETAKLWAEQGALPMSMNPEEFDKYLRDDIVKWAAVVKQISDKPQ